MEVQIIENLTPRQYGRKIKDESFITEGGGKYVRA